MSDSLFPSSRQNRRLTAAVATLLGLAVVSSQAATFTWQAPNTGDWTNGANWVGGGAPTGTDTSDVLIFDGTFGAYTSTNNIPGPFLLNRLELNATDTISQRTLAAAAGSSLLFSGAAPLILQSAAGSFSIKIPISSTVPLVLSGPVANSVVTLDGPLTGFFDITKTGANTFRFGSLGDLVPSANNWVGTLTIENGTMRFNNNAFSAPTALRSNPVVLTSVGSVLSTQFKKSIAEGTFPPAPTNADPKTSLRVGTLSGTSGLVLARRETNSASTFDSADIVITALVDGTFAGTVRNKANANVGETAGDDDGELVVRGVAHQTFTGTVDLSKDVVVGQGATVTFAGAATLGAQASGAVVLNGGTFRLDNSTTNNANRLRNGVVDSTGLESVGGGTFSLVGNTAGTLEIISRLQLGTANNARSGALTLNVTQPVGSTGATELRLQSLSRDNGAPQFSTLHFIATDSAGEVRNLGLTGNNPRITFATLPPTGSGGLLVNNNVAGVGIGIGWATVSRAAAAGAVDMDFATVATGTGVAPVTTLVAQPGFVGSSTNTNLRVESSTTTGASGTNFAASVKLAPNAEGQQLTLGGANLSTNAILLAGNRDFTIAATGASAIAGSSTRFFHVQKATLTVSAPVTGSSQPIVKAGAGTLALTAPTNVSLIQPTVINEGVLRATPGSSLPGGDVRLRGGVLELQGNGTSTTSFTRQIGTGANRLNWADPLVNQDRGSGGFSAIGSDADVTITGFTGQTTISWEDTGFVESGYALTFGSSTADRAVNWTSNLSLTAGTTAYPGTNTDGTLGSTSPNYDAREFRVNDNIAVTTDRARISGAISGTLYEDLLKSGAGLLELSGANTYTGATLIDEGTLLVNGSSTSFLTDVRSGAILGGKGSVKGVRVQTGGTLSPGEIAGVTGQTSSFTINGDLSFAGADSKVQFELATGSYDQLQVNGNVYLEGADLVGFLLGGFLATTNDLFFLIINDGTDSVKGQFAQGSSVNFGGQTFGISYTGDSASQSLTGGNDIVLHMIPEPATALLLGTGLLLLGGGRRRRSVR